jgi:hypothetical protein
LGDKCRSEQCWISVQKGDCGIGFSQHFMVEFRVALQEFANETQARSAGFVEFSQVKWFATALHAKPYTAMRPRIRPYPEKENRGGQVAQLRSEWDLAGMAAPQSALLFMTSGVHAGDRLSRTPERAPAPPVFKSLTADPQHAVFPA